jgi:hypothetical protein
MPRYHLCTHVAGVMTHRRCLVPETSACLHLKHELCMRSNTAFLELVSPFLPCSWLGSKAQASLLQLWLGTTLVARLTVATMAPISLLRPARVES